MVRVGERGQQDLGEKGVIVRVRGDEVGRNSQKDEGTDNDQTYDGQPISEETPGCVAPQGAMPCGSLERNW
jgi:hypothetical protein